MICGGAALLLARELPGDLGASPAAGDDRRLAG
jgi:hypothetical protein